MRIASFLLISIFIVTICVFRCGGSGNNENNTDNTKKETTEAESTNTGKETTGAESTNTETGAESTNTETGAEDLISKNCKKNDLSVCWGDDYYLDCSTGHIEYCQSDSYCKEKCDKNGLCQVDCLGVYGTPSDPD